MDRMPMKLIRRRASQRSKGKLLPLTRFNFPLMPSRAAPLALGCPE